MAVYFARNAFSGKRGELDKGILEAMLALPEGFGQQALGAEGKDLDILKLEGSRPCWRVKDGNWRAAFYRVGGDFTVVLVSQRKDFYEVVKRRGLTRKSNRLQYVTMDEFVDSVSKQERAPRPEVADSNDPNDLAVYSDAELRQIDLVGEGTLKRIRQIPGGVDLVDALQDFVESVDLVELLSDMADRPAHYREMYENGISPSVEAFQAEFQEVLDRLSPADSPESFVTAESVDELETILDGSLEDWMVFLREEQRSLVAASYNGPSRIGGGPGTGKTVVALHRAIQWGKELAREVEDPKVLMTTFVKTLPTHWETLLQRMNGNVAETVVCRNVDSLAMGIVMKARRGKKVNFLESEERLAFAKRAIKKHGIKDRMSEDPSLLVEEFDHFISGRGIETREEYLALDRVGAGVALGPAARELVYSAYEDYSARLKETDRWDWQHLQLEALRLAELGRLPDGYGFNAVIVDEAQDLSAVQVRLLLALDKSEDHKRFLLVGDGQQRIYRGGFTLRQVGIDVGGRSRILRGNWRNTYWIWAVAQQITDGVPFPELEDSDEVRSKSRSSEPRREGEPVTLHVVDGQQAELDRVCKLAGQLGDDGHEIGECAIVVSKVGREKQILGALKANGIPAMPMADWEGSSSGKIAVGTAHRAKGLEFKQVIVCGMSAQERIAAIEKSSALTEDEALALELRLATVAITRARDSLHIVSAGKPWAPIQAAADLMVNGG